MIVSLVGIAIAAVTPASSLWIGLLWGVTGFGMGLAYSTVSLVALQSAPRGHEGSVSAALRLCDVLGGAIGAGLSGAIVAFVRERLSIGAGIALADVSLALLLCYALIAGSRLPGKRTMSDAARDSAPVPSTDAP